MTRRLLTAAAALAACIACGKDSPTAPAPTPTPVAISVAGTVSSGGARVPNANVRIHDGPNAGRATTTNASGEYSLDNLAAGNANVVASTFIHGEVVLGLTLNGAHRLEFTLPTPACQSNNTAWVTFGNRSTTTAQDVIWDGVRTASGIQPGQNSPEFSVAAGVPHTLLFRVANSTRSACSQGSPVIAQCERRLLTCTGP
jgi:hypothetical protein